MPQLRILKCWENIHKVDIHMLVTVYAGQRRREELITWVLGKLDFPTRHVHGVGH